MSRSVWIAGIHRSGTSAVAGICHHLGVDMGPQLGDLGKNPSNPKGQFEDLVLVQSINRVGSWRLPAQLIPSGHMLHAMHLYIHGRDNTEALWGYKSPQLCMVGKYLITAAKDPTLIIVRRNFMASCESLAARDGYPLPAATTLQSQYFFGLYDFLANVSNRTDIPIIHIDYEKLLADPETIVNALAKTLDVEVTDDALSFIDPSLNHHAT